MRKITILLVVLVFMACDATTKQSEHKYEYEPTAISESTKQLEKEIYDLLCKLDESDCMGVYECVDILVKRFDDYLRRPETFENDMPLLKEHMSIEYYPLNNHKIYQFSYPSGGTMGYCSVNYIQYRTKSGEVTYVPFRNDLCSSAQFSFEEFRYDDSTYYFVEQYAQGSSCSYSIYCTIISINDGEITYHTEFYPERFEFKPGSEEYFIYDESGDIVSDEWRPNYFMWVCGTENANSNVRIEFNPKRLTVTVWDDADTTESRTGATTKSKWKFEMKK